MSSYRSVRPAAFALGIIIFIGGVLIAVLVGWPKLRTARASSAWPTVEGEIIVSEVDERMVGGARTYGARVEYRYTVDEHDYDGSTVHVGGDYRAKSPESAEELVAKYPAGQSVTVHYDPARPGTSVLEPGGGINSYAVLTMGIAVAAVGLTLVLPLLPGMLASEEPSKEAIRDPHIVERFKRWTNAASGEGE